MFSLFYECTSPNILKTAIIFVGGEVDGQHVINAIIENNEVHWQTTPDIIASIEDRNTAIFNL